MITILFVLWVVFACYCLVCIFIPEIRLLRWFGSGARLGALSHICVAWCFGSPLLMATGVLAHRYSTLLYTSIILAMIMLFVGWRVDEADDPGR